MNAHPRSPITSHVLDVSRGKPAAGIGVVLSRLERGGRWKTLRRAKTNADGRAESLLTPGSKLAPGVYRLEFASKAYFKSRKIETFYPDISVVFEVAGKPGGAPEHYHVPLLLSPFGYSTYRGT